MKRRTSSVYKWKIRTAKNYKELEKLVESIQDDGWTVEKIDMNAIAVIAYRPKKERLDDTDDWGDKDYGQQRIN